MRPTFFCLLGMLTLTQSACSPPTPDDAGQADSPPAQSRRPTAAGPLRLLAGSQQVEVETILPLLATKQLIFIGEDHDRYDHHLNQLTLIQRLYAIDPRLTLGLEMFQQPAQPYLDAYIAGQIDERELLEQSRYFERWGFDYRLYRPILRYAREKSMALLALNVPTEIIRQVSQGGLHSVRAADRAWIPKIDKSDQAYRERLLSVFEQHPGITAGNFEHFLEAQLLWDEAMAERVARYLQARPEQRLIVLAGNGHLAYGAGIPKRVRRRLPVTMATILQGEASFTEMQGADYVVLSERIALPPAGRLGVALDAQAEGPGLRVIQVTPHGGAQQAGIRVDDRLFRIANQPVSSMAEVWLALLDKNPGDVVSITIRRDQPDSKEDLVLSVTLQPQWTP